MIDELATWLRVQLDEDERVAREAEGGWITLGPDPERTNSVGRHAARWDPPRVLAEVEAKRRILDAWQAEGADRHPGVPCENWPGQGAENYDPYESCAHHLAAPPRTPDHVVRFLAQPYAGRDGWREDWRL